LDFVEGNEEKFILRMSKDSQGREEKSLRKKRQDVQKKEILKRSSIELSIYLLPKST